jgi:undecaprenyl-diphosphatase
MIAFDENLFLWINGLAGNIAFVDEFFKGIANDYFFIVSACLVLLFLWFGTRGTSQREKNQLGVIVASAGLGIAQAFVELTNSILNRPRPFTELPTNLLFYQPTDPSFPSNSAAVIFAIAVAIFLVNRRVGAVLFGLAILHSFSRIYVGIHYPLDILGGAAMGTLAALLIFGLIKLLGPWPGRLLKLLRSFYLA